MRVPSTAQIRRRPVCWCLVLLRAGGAADPSQPFTFFLARVVQPLSRRKNKNTGLSSASANNSAGDAERTCIALSYFFACACTGECVCVRVLFIRSGSVNSCCLTRPLRASTQWVEKVGGGRVPCAGDHKLEHKRSGRRKKKHENQLVVRAGVEWEQRQRGLGREQKKKTVRERQGDGWS